MVLRAHDWLSQRLSPRKCKHRFEKMDIRYFVTLMILTVDTADSAVNLVKYQTHVNRHLASPDQFEILQGGEV